MNMASNVVTDVDAGSSQLDDSVSNITQEVASNATGGSMVSL